MFQRLVPGLLRLPDFRSFWLGQAISVLGDQISVVAWPLVAVLVLKADAAQMGLLTAAALLPHLLFSLPAGVWLDRIRRRRRLMIAADLLRAALAATIPVAYVLGALRLEQLFVVAFLNGTLAVVFDISWATVFAEVAPRERYVDANTILNASRSVATVAGPTIGGFLVQLLTAPMAILADALSYVASAIFLGRVRAEEPPIVHDPTGIRAQVMTGLSFMVHDAIIRPTLLSVATVNLFNFGFSALVVLYATRDLGVAPGLLGAVLGAGAIGAVIGAASAAAIGRRIGLGPAYVLGLVLFPAPLVLVPLAGLVATPGGPNTLVLAMLFLAEFGAGFGVMILDVNAGSFLIARTPERIRSRAMGSFRFVNMGVRPIGALLGGFLGSLLTVQATLFITSIGALLGVLTLIGSPLLGLRDLPDAAEVDAA
jgi:MFS family permease